MYLRKRRNSQPARQATFKYGRVLRLPNLKDHGQLRRYWPSPEACDDGACHQEGRAATALQNLNACVESKNGGISSPAKNGSLGNSSRFTRQQQLVLYYSRDISGTVLN